MNNEKKLPDDISAKKAIIDIGNRMYVKNFCAANDGNISCKAEDGNIWVTPSGVSKGFLNEEMLIKTDLDGNVLISQGNYKVSSELKLHLNIYKSRPDMNAVVHAHPPVSTAFACARKNMEKPVVTESILSLGTVPCAPFAVPGSQELADSILPYVHGHAAVLLANHGIVTWGESAVQAYFRLETAEYYANMLVLSGEMPIPTHELTEEELAAVLAYRDKSGIRF